MKNLKHKAIYLKLPIIFFILISVLSCLHTPESPNTSIETIDIEVSSAFFTPAMEFTSAATVTIDYGDGTTPIVVPIEAPTGSSARNHVFNKYNFADVDPTHIVKVNVEPWSALKVLNLGFRAGDGGNDTYTNGLDLISLHPADNNPLGLEVNTWIRGVVGEVTEIKGLSTATNLYAVCFDSQPVEEIDLSGCVNLRTLEAYFSSLKKTNFTGCTNLIRCSIEATGARYSWRIINGQRVEDASLDLADCVGLRDIRGSADDHDLLKLHPQALNTLWHLCKWGNPHFTHVKIGNEVPQKLDVRRFTALRQLWIGGSPLIGELIINNGVTDSVWGNNCGITSVNTVNQTQIYQLQLQDNNITSIDISGCTNLQFFELNNNQLSAQQLTLLLEDLMSLANLRLLILNDCSLNQSQVDMILATLNAYADPGTLYEWDTFSVDLRGASNAAPSATAAATVQALISSPRHWTVLTN